MAVPEIRALDRPTLPVFILRTPSRTGETIAQNILDQSLPVASIPLIDDTVRYAVTGAHVDVNQRTGSVWIARDPMWSVPSLDEATLAGLPQTVPGAGDGSPLLGLGRSLVENPPGGITIAVEKGWTRGSRLVVWTRATGKRRSYYLDRTESLAFTLTAPKFELAGVPLSGGGARLAGRFSASGGWLGLSAAVPVVDRVLDEFPVISRAAADDQVRERYGRFDAALFDAVLSYQVLDAEGERYLCPFWDYEIVVRRGNAYIPIGVVRMPAVRFPAAAQVPPVEPKIVKRPPDQGVHWGPSPEKPRMLLSWLGERVKGHPSTLLARNRIVTTMAVNGWNCRDCGEEDAAEKDWHRLADLGVNAAELGCYIGHANANSMMFCEPADESLSYDDCQFGGDRLRWVVFDACGPLHDSVAASGGSAFDVWARIFDGLRFMVAFATPQRPNEAQLWRALVYALAGQPLAKAWFQSVCETQGSATNNGRPAWVAGMFAVDGTTTTIEDRLSEKTPAGAKDPAMLAGVWIPMA